MPTDSLEEVVQRVVSNLLPTGANETDGIRAVIYPILDALGWDVFRKEHADEVSDEYGLANPSGGSGKKFVDIALLKTKGIKRPLAFVEAKAPGRRLSDHVDQVLEYAYREGVDICVLTNAYDWWLFYPSHRGRFMQRLVAQVRLREDPPEDSATELQLYLGRNNVIEGKAAKRAERTLKEEEEREYLERNLPTIWREMLSGPSDSHNKLLDLLGEIVREEHDISDAQELISDFLSQQSPSSRSTVSSVAPDITVIDRASPDETATDSNDLAAGNEKKRRPRNLPVSYILWGAKHQSDSQSAFLREFVKQVWERHPDDFHKAMSLGKGIHFSNDEECLELPKQIAASEFYMEGNRNAISLLEGAYWVLDQFGYDRSALTVGYPEGVVGPGTLLIPGNESLQVEGKTPRPSKFSLFGRDSQTKSHTAVAMSVWTEMWERHSDRFSELEERSENFQPFISKDVDVLNRPKPIGSSGYFAGLYSMRTQERAIWFCNRLLTLFGHPPDVLEIEFTQRED